MIREVCSCGSKENIWKGTKRGTLALHYGVRSGKEACKSGTVCGVGVIDWCGWNYIRDQL